MHSNLFQVTSANEMYLLVCIFHDGCKQGIDQQIFNSLASGCFWWF